MSEIDRIFAERETKRQEKERDRRARFDVACAFLQEFFDRDVAPSKALTAAGIEAKLTGSRILLHRTNAGIYADAFQIAIGPEGEVDIAGRSLGQYHPDHKVNLKRELITEMLTFFDL